MWAEHAQEGARAGSGCAPQPRGYLFLACAIVIHAMLGGHDSGSVQGGGVEGHPLHIGNVAGEIGQAWAVCLVWVPPVLEELLEQWGLTTLRKDRDLKEARKGKNVTGLKPPGQGPPSRGPWGASDSPGHTEGAHSPHPSHFSPKLNPPSLS